MTQRSLIVCRFSASTGSEPRGKLDQLCKPLLFHQGNFSSPVLEISQGRQNKHSLTLIAYALTIDGSEAKTITIESAGSLRSNAGTNG